jgi:hypothetical protein
MNQNRSEFFTKLLKSIVGIFLVLFIPQKLFAEKKARLNKVKVIEHPDAIKRRKQDSR